MDLDLFGFELDGSATTAAPMAPNQSLILRFVVPPMMWICGQHEPPSCPSTPLDVRVTRIHYHGNRSDCCRFTIHPFRERGGAFFPLKMIIAFSDFILRQVLASFTRLLDIF